MEKILKKISVLVISLLVMFSCTQDFDEINIDPNAANVDQVQVEYFINNAIGGAQQNPHISERIFALYWMDAVGMGRVGALPTGFHSDSWTSDYFNSYVSTWLRNITNAITVADEKIASGSSVSYTNNLKQIARIWRVYIMSEMTDNFGPIPTDGFQGENPDYKSVKDVYYFMLSELADAVSLLDESVDTAPSADFDQAYGFDYTKWKKYGNSLRMRLSMRLSEVDPGKAQQEFEAAVNSQLFIASLDDNFEVQEIADGWNNYSGVMSRPWTSFKLGPKLNNLMIGLGGIQSEDMLDASYHQYIKNANYMGLKYENHISMKTNDPSAGFWLDGLHHSIDPRAYALYAIAGDVNNSEYNTSNGGSTSVLKSLFDENGDVEQEIDVSFTWNTISSGNGGLIGTRGAQLTFNASTPRIVNKYRNGDNERVFYGSWESYFLIAEAAVRGWNVPMSGQSAYEAGIQESFNYNDVSNYFGSYLSSENYNRNGTSVSWSHTAEPPSTITMNYIDGYTQTPGTFNYAYPTNHLYQGGAFKNDHLTKIITQKFIAQTPWLPLEVWNDQRRLGLPFFQNPIVEEPLVDLPALNSGNFMESRVEFLPQRLKYPSSFEANIPDKYNQAVSLLGGENSIFTPLWWAKQN